MAQRVMTKAPMPKYRSELYGCVLLINYLSMEKVTVKTPRGNLRHPLW